MKRFLASAGVGCHIAWYNMPGSEWTLGYYPLDTLDTLDTIDTTEPVESLPEISIDPGTPCSTSRCKATLTERIRGWSLKCHQH